MIEDVPDGGCEVHVHTGGQGAWVAGLAAELGAVVRLCGAFGGESGAVVAGLLERSGIDVAAVRVSASSGSVVLDRRRGDDHGVVEIPSPALSRHEVDDLYGAMLVAGLETGVCVLAGSQPRVVPPDLFRRLATDLGAADKVVIADLHGEQLEAALEGGVSILKISHEELLDDALADGEDVDALVGAIERLRKAGARDVIVSRAAEPALATLDGQIVEVVPPAFEPLDPRGAGDSFTAALAVAHARQAGSADALRLATAAGALNATRRGLGTGRREDVERLAPFVELRPLLPTRR